VIRVKPPVLPHGNNQQSPATQHLIGTALGSIPGTRTAQKKSGRVSKRGRARTASAAGRRRRKASRSSKRAHMVKGSAAAKRHMAKLRKMRKK